MHSIAFLAGMVSGREVKSPAKRSKALIRDALQ